MNRNVVITGAGGFVGSHMAEGFLDMGDTVIAIDSLFDNATRARLSKAELVEAPLSADVVGKGRNIDIVIHGAAITTLAEELGLSASQHVQTNVELLNASLDLAMANGASDFIFISSSGVFALDDGVGFHLESTPPTASIPYAVAKRAGEDMANAANSSSFRVLSVRLGPIYGPHEVTRNTRRIVSQLRRWLDQLDRCQPIVVTVPDECRDWTFAPDLPHALDALLAIQPAVSGVVHLTSMQIVSNLDLARALTTLVPGSEIVVERTGDSARLPMVSDRIDMGSLYAWTPLVRGILQTYSAEVAR